MEVTLDDSSLIHEGFEYALSAETLDAVGETSELFLGIRPADISVDPEGPISATVEILEELGDENLIHVELAGESYTVVVGPGFRPETGDQVRLTFDESDIYLFDRATEESLKTRGEQHAKEKVDL
jgi:multiple sugar transport system ATP-binding protein